MARVSTQDQDAAIAQLHAILKPGDTVYCILRHVSRSGMMRHIDLYTIKENQHIYLSGLVAKACGENRTDNGAIKVSGCGMDMGFALVSYLSCTLYPNGFTCIGDRCPSNDHFNGDRDYTPHGHKSGEYALQHRWL